MFCLKNLPLETGCLVDGVGDSNLPQGLLYTYVECKVLAEIFVWNFALIAMFYFKIGLGSLDGGPRLKEQEVYFNLLDCKCTLTLVK